MIQGYPKHIYDPVRVQIAQLLIDHELYKFGYKSDNSTLINSPDLANPRDFWNGFHGLVMGFKLQLGIVQLLTAENVSWSLQDVDLKTIKFGSIIEQTRIIDPDKSISVPEMQDYYHQPENQNELQKQLDFSTKILSQMGKFAQDPVILVEKEDRDTKQKILSVYDGHNRLAKAVLEGKSNISAYLGKFTDQTLSPQNYWFPTSVLMEILTLIRHSEPDSDLFKATIVQLKHILQSSDSARFELLNRALTPRLPEKHVILKALGLEI